MVLKGGQWYQLPAGQWVRAISVADPPGQTWLGPILQRYGVDVASSDGYKPIEDIYIYPDGTLSVTGSMTWETWTLADLREATPDEAEERTRRIVGLVNASQLTSTPKSE